MLTGLEIKRQVERGTIIYEGGDLDRYLNTNSIDLTLYPEILEVVLNGDAIDIKHHEACLRYSHKVIPPTGFIIRPTCLGYLACTNETVGSNVYAMQLSDKSSMGRLFLSTHFNAGFGDLGFGMNKEQWTLELVTRAPFKLYPNMRICQVGFTETVGPRNMNYTLKGRYVGQRGPTPWRQKED